MLRLLAALLCLLLAPFAHAQADPSDDGFLDTPIALQTETATDADIQARLADIYSRLEGLDGVEVAVEAGIVELSGSVYNEALATRAVGVARRVEGVVAVDDGVERTLDVGENVGAASASIFEWLDGARKALPLIALAFGVWVGLSLLGGALGRLVVHSGGIPGRRGLNPFLAQVLAQAVKIVFFVVGLVVALNLLGASGVVTTILGGAGVLGIAFGFAIRDTLENYISSILLSIRQPFRSGDHVVINDQLEGKVARLTARATVLVTLDGNQLRIPNADVFKGTILNYTTNPSRRFRFRLGVDSADDPVHAIEVGLARMLAFPFVLRDPEPSANIVEVGDSSVVIEYFGWVNQTETEFPHARSIVIQAVKAVLEDSGFSLPEPIYRLRIDGLDAGALPKVSTPMPPATKPPATKHTVDLSATEGVDLTLKPYNSIDEQVAEEAAKDNLLSNSAAVE